MLWFHSKGILSRTGLGGFMLEIVDFLRRRAPWVNLPQSALDQAARSVDVHYWAKGELWPASSSVEAGAELVVVRKGRLKASYRGLAPDGAVPALQLTLLPGDTLPLTSRGRAWSLEALEDSLLYLWTTAPFCDDPVAAGGDVAGAGGDRGGAGSAYGELEALPGEPYSILPGDLNIAESLEFRRTAAGLLVVPPEGNQAATGFVLSGPPATGAALPHSTLQVVTTEGIVCWLQAGTLSEYTPVTALAAQVPLLPAGVAALEAAYWLGLSHQGLCGIQQSAGGFRIHSLRTMMPLMKRPEVLAAYQFGQEVARGGGETPLPSLLADVIRHAPQQAAFLMSLGHDRITQTLVERWVFANGPAPAPFAWMAAGGWGRMEAEAEAVQQHVLVWADTPHAEAARFFQGMASAVTAGLEAAGLVREGASMLAASSAWCKPLSVWKGYVQAWASRMDAEDSDMLMPLVAARPVAGDARLGATFCELFGAVASAPAFRMARTLRVEQRLRDLAIAHGGLSRHDADSAQQVAGQESGTDERCVAVWQQQLVLATDLAGLLCGPSAWKAGRLLPAISACLGAAGERWAGVLGAPQLGPLFWENWSDLALLKGRPMQCSGAQRHATQQRLVRLWNLLSAAQWDTVRGET